MPYPEPTVSAVIINSNNEVLLCKSRKWNNQYIIPGGHIEYGEKMEDALKREVREETGLNIFDIRLLSIQECIKSTSFVGEKHFISFDYICRTENSKVTLNEEADSFIWAPFSEVLNYDLGGFVRNLFIEMQKGDSSVYRNFIYYNYSKQTN